MYLRLVILALITTSLKWDQIGLLQIFGSATSVAMCLVNIPPIPALP